MCDNCAEDGSEGSEQSQELGAFIQMSGELADQQPYCPSQIQLTPTLSFNGGSGLQTVEEHWMVSGADPPPENSCEGSSVCDLDTAYDDDAVAHNDDAVPYNDDAVPYNNAAAAYNNYVAAYNDDAAAAYNDDAIQRSEDSTPATPDQQAPCTPGPADQHTTLATEHSTHAAPEKACDEVSTPVGKLLPHSSSASKQFSTPEEFAEWLSSSNAITQSATEEDSTDAAPVKDKALPAVQPADSPVEQSRGDCLQCNMPVLKSQFREKTRKGYVHRSCMPDFTSSNSKYKVSPKKRMQLPGAGGTGRGRSLCVPKLALSNLGGGGGKTDSPDSARTWSINTAHSDEAIAEAEARLQRRQASIKAAHLRRADGVASVSSPSRGICVHCNMQVLVSQHRVKCDTGYVHRACISQAEYNSHMNKPTEPSPAVKVQQNALFAGMTPRDAVEEEPDPVLYRGNSAIEMGQPLQL